MFNVLLKLDCALDSSFFHRLEEDDSTQESRLIAF